MNKRRINAKMGTPIMGNKITGDLSTVGWQTYTRENGAWALTFADGKHHYEYRPTAERQLSFISRIEFLLKFFK